MHRLRYAKIEGAMLHAKTAGKAPGHTMALFVIEDKCKWIRTHQNNLVTALVLNTLLFNIKISQENLDNLFINPLPNFECQSIILFTLDLL